MSGDISLPQDLREKTSRLSQLFTFCNFVEGLQTSDPPAIVSSRPFSLTCEIKRGDLASFILWLAKPGQRANEWLFPGDRASKWSEWRGNRGVLGLISGTLPTSIYFFMASFSIQRLLPLQLAWPGIAAPSPGDPGPQHFPTQRCPVQFHVLMPEGTGRK